MDREQPSRPLQDHRPHRDRDEPRGTLARTAPAPRYPAAGAGR